MEPKKNPDIYIGRNSSLYFAIGLNVMLLFTWLLLEHKTYVSIKEYTNVGIVITEIEEDIPITNQDFNIPPPPPQLKVIPEIIMLVSDEVEIEESIIESSETSQDEKIIKYQPVAVKEVEVEEPEEEVEVAFAVVEQVPIFPGCTGNNTELKKCFQQKISDHISKKLKYPEIAIENEQQGKVYVMFNIDKNGFVSNTRVRGPYKILENEALRIISLLPKMEPARQRNVPVKVPYAVPIVFKLSNS